MKEFKIDPTALSIPWIESPFYQTIVRNKVDTGEITSEEYYICNQYNKDGYIVLDLELEETFINELHNEIDNLIKSEKLKTQEEGYHYNTEAPRVFEAWKTCKNVLSLAKHPKILKTLELLYGRKPIPFQTINFTKGSNQPLHSDAIHFSSIPERWLVGSWTALEDMDANNGTLIFAPKSHTIPLYHFKDLGLDVPKYGEQFSNYAIYEQFIKDLVDVMHYKVEQFITEKGRVLLWAAHLLHGGDKIRDPKRTRKSQATHYYFEGCEHYIAPMFSDFYNGVFSEKNLIEKDILNYKIS